MHPLTRLWEATGRPAPNWQGKATREVAPPAPRRGACALTGERGDVWPLSAVTTTLTTLDRLPYRDIDPDGCALGPSAAWALRHRLAMQRPHATDASGRLVEVGSTGLCDALMRVSSDPHQWVLVPQSRQKHLLPWGTPGMVRTDDESLPWGGAETERLAAYRRLRTLGFGETALAQPAPPWVVMRNTADRRAVLADWPLLAPWRAHPAYLDVAARATRKDKDA